jgi:hypothetical protein
MASLYLKTQAPGRRGRHWRRWLWWCALTVRIAKGCGAARTAAAPPGAGAASFRGTNREDGAPPRNGWRCKQPRKRAVIDTPSGGCPVVRVALGLQRIRNQISHSCNGLVAPGHKKRSISLGTRYGLQLWERAVRCGRRSGVEMQQRGREGVMRRNAIRRRGFGAPKGAMALSFIVLCARGGW